MNCITITGRVGNVKVFPPKTDKNKVMMVLGVADTYWDSAANERKAQWWNIKIYGKRAEGLTKYLQKGTNVTIVGRLMPDDYTPKDGAAKVKSYQIFADNVHFVNDKRMDEKPEHDESTQQYDPADAW